MKNHISLALLLIFAIYSRIYSQVTLGKYKKLSVGISVGMNLPVGGYSKSDSSLLPVSGVSNGHNMDTISGYAKAGFHFNVFVAYMFAPDFGVMASVGGNFNTIDVSTITSQTDGQYISHGFSGTPPTFTSSGSYYIGEYLIGPYFELPGTKKFSVELKLLLGVITANYPTLIYTYNYMGTLATQTESIKSGNGFGYSFGGGFKYIVASGLIGLHIGITYTGTNITYPNYSISYSSGGITIPSQTYNNPKNMPWLGIFQLTLGGSIEL